MALKNFIKANSYTRIEELLLHKKCGSIMCSLDVYNDSSKAERLIKEMRVAITIDEEIEQALKNDTNFLSLCYNKLKLRPEFQDTEDC